MGGGIQPGHGLDGVGVEDGTGRPLGHNAGHLVEGLDGTDLVVDGHDRNQSDVVPARIGQCVEIDLPVGPAANLAPLGASANGEVLAGPEDGVVLHRRADHGRRGTVHP